MKNEMQVIVVTSEKMYHCLSPFMYLWDKYAGFDDFKMTVCLFKQTDFIYRPLCDVHSLGDFADWPASRWSEQLTKILDEIAAPQFLLMLEDYWLTRPVDVKALSMLFAYASQFENVLKVDVTHDRLYINGGSNFLFDAGTYDNCGYLDLIKSPHGTAYQMSLWGGIWNREQIKRVLVPGETAQDIEIAGTRRVTEDQLVLGTRQAPLLHGNIYQSRNEGKAVYEDSYWAIKPVDLGFMRGKGWI